MWTCQTGKILFLNVNIWVEEQEIFKSPLSAVVLGLYNLTLISFVLTMPNSK